MSSFTFLVMITLLVLLVSLPMLEAQTSGALKTILRQFLYDTRQKIDQALFFLEVSTQRI